MAYEAIDDCGRLVKLRVPRACEWCGELIERSEVAVVRVYRFDGDFVDARMHPECHEAMRRYYALPDTHPNDCFDGGGMKRGDVTLA